MFADWPPLERARLQVAYNALDKAARWKSMRQHRGQPPGTDTCALLEIARDVKCELHKAHSTIAEDAAFAARLQRTVDKLEAAQQPQMQGSAALRAQSVPQQQSAGAADTGQHHKHHRHQDMHDGQAICAGLAKLGWTRRQLCAVQYRREQKLARRALLWLLAVVAYAWGEDSLLQDVLCMGELRDMG